MKSKNLIFYSSLIAIVFLFFSCMESGTEISDSLSSMEKSGVKANSKNLSDDEIAGIMFMREEEKLARDVYLVLNESSPHRVFQNIAESEQKHTDAILHLIDFYNLDDPAEGKGIGEFENQELQHLFDYFILKGEECLDSALVVGAIIEETDILDIEELKEATDVKNIIQVYGNLLSGSENHLRAYVHVLSKQGIKYIPRYISQERFDEIIN